MSAKETRMLLRIDGAGARDLGSAVGQAVADVFTTPEHRWSLAGGILLPLIVFRGRPPSPLALGIMCGIGCGMGRLGYRAAANLETIARAVEGDDLTTPEHLLHQKAGDAKA